MRHQLIIFAFMLLPFVGRTHADDSAAPAKLTAMDVFQLEFAGDPQISPDGKRIVYVRQFCDVKDKRVPLPLREDVKGPLRAWSGKQ